MTDFRLIAAALALGMTAGTAVQAADEWRAMPDHDGRPDWTLGIGEVPFERGAMSIIAVEAGELRTYRLVPCRNNAAICAWSPNGPAARVQVSVEGWQVSGIYGGRTFEIWPGGGGAIRYDSGGSTALAWNAVE